MTKRITQLNNERKKLLSEVKIREIVGEGGAENCMKSLNEDSDEVDVELKVAIEGEKSRIDLAEICVSQNQ